MAKSHKLNVYGLGQHGINRVKSPVHVLDGELLSAQNATVRPVQGQLAITKRDGMAKINSDAAAGTLASITNIPTLIFGEPQICIPISNRAWEAGAWSPELNLFAVVGRGSTTDCVATSDDGVNWTLRTHSSTSDWQDICWSAELGLFVAVGNTLVMTSPDGITWTDRSCVSGTWRGVTYSPDVNLLVAVGQTPGTGRIMTSPNGINWTDRTTGAMGGEAFRKVTWADSIGLFVAVANTNASTSNVSTSPDGITWTDRSTPDTVTLRDVAWSPELDILAAVGSTSLPPGTTYVTSSTDGITWTARSYISNFSAWAVAWSPELRIFLAAQEGSVAFRAATSEDGINWTNISPNCSQSVIHDVVWSPALEKFLLIADDEMELIGYG